MKKTVSYLVILCLLFTLFTGCVKEEEIEEVVKIEEEIEEVAEPSEFYKNMMDESRPIAVMIDNDGDYKGPQTGLNNAYMIYEVYVEGGNTRMMALFKDSFFDENSRADKIGPVRSARHYFLDFAIENDAIYAHCGWSPKAQSEISSRGVNNLNGLYDGTTFYRYSAYNNTWHNLYTDYEKLLNASSKAAYRTDTDISYNYHANYEAPTRGESALKIVIPYLQCNIAYTYDEENNSYYRVRRGSPHEMQTGEVLSPTNILIIKMQNVDLNDGEGKGRQDLYNTGSGEGYYITGGKAINITWEKDTRSAKTRYLSNGEEIILNPGQTFVQVVPPAMNLTIE